MEFSEALALVEKIVRDPYSLTLAECFEINKACAIVAIEYTKIKDRIMPA